MKIHKTPYSSLFLWLHVTLLWLLNGCLSTTSQHLNTGRILAPGVVEDTWSLANTTVIQCNGTMVRNRDGYMVCQPDETDWSSAPKKKQYSMIEIPSLATSWRLGVREQWGPFTGVDMGWAMEFPGTLEFDGRFGLPFWENYPSWKHSIAIGWGIGNWADNTWYTEYAFSYAAGKHALFFCNFRESWLSTQIVELEFNEFEDNDENQTEVFKSHRRFVHQLSLGTKLGPTGMKWLPNYYSFGLHLTAPVIFYGGGDPYSVDKKSFPWYNTQYSIGLTWN